MGIFRQLGCDLPNCAAAVATTTRQISAVGGRTIEVAVGIKDHAALRVGTITAAGEIIEIS